MPAKFSADLSRNASGIFGADIYLPLVEHMLNGVAYCRMLYEDGQPIDFRYLYTNPAFEKLTGLKQVDGKLVSEVMPNIRASNSELFEIYSRVALGGEAQKLETYSLHYECGFLSRSIALSPSILSLFLMSSASARTLKWRFAKTSRFPNRF